MTPDELRDAFAEEGERAERKESDRDADEILRAACALANDLQQSGRPGYLVLGLDKKGRTVGVDASDEGVQRLVNRLTSTKILPTPSFSVEVVPSQGLSVIVVRVQPYPVPPIVKVDGVAWVRVGNTTRRATAADLARLSERRPVHTLPYDLRPLGAASRDDLNLELLRNRFSAEKEVDPERDTFPSFEAWLSQRDVLRQLADGWAPTAAGLLVYGLDPRRCLPGAIVELARYAGLDFDAPISSRKTISGPLGDQLQTLWTQLQAHVSEVPGPQVGIRSPYYPEYPLEGLKELARNLVQHRLYEGTNAPSRIAWMDDRVVFTNPGSRFGLASEGEFGEHSDYRNPTVTRFLVELGYVERLGRGIRRVRVELERNGNPPLEVETDGYTTVTVRRRA